FRPLQIADFGFPLTSENEQFENVAVIVIRQPCPKLFDFLAGQHAVAAFLRGSIAERRRVAFGRPFPASPSEELGQAGACSIGLDWAAHADTCQLGGNGALIDLGNRQAVKRGKVLEQMAFGLTEGFHPPALPRQEQLNASREGFIGVRAAFGLDASRTLPKPDLSVELGCLLACCCRPERRGTSKRDAGVLSPGLALVEPRPRSTLSY